ncbi:hypothetical protein [Thermodesulfobium narugense]|uniref:hypothetical protein n=1 Tax=Thermodesulfobium narugense TaxID=184064 RepID=UPI0012B61DCF|nr:hypothetical protein [Thermodesulfobium narugense]
MRTYRCIKVLVSDLMTAAILPYPRFQMEVCGTYIAQQFRAGVIPFPLDKLLLANVISCPMLY